MEKKVFELVSEIVNELLNIIFPPQNTCICCEEDEVAGICNECYKRIRRVNNLNEYRSFGYYSGELKKLILEFKYNNNFLAGKILTDFIINMLSSYKLEADLITSIPTTKKKIRQRGFNQSEVLAEGVADALNMPYIRTLYKAKESREQKSLSKKLREENIKGMYIFNSKQNISGKKIILLDDVITTGATINECSRILYKNGAKKVIKVSVACGEF